MSAASGAKPAVDRRRDLEELFQAYRSEHPGDGRKRFSVANMGKGRWYWGVWAAHPCDLDVWHARPEASGYAPTWREAHEAARVAAGPEAKHVAAALASSYHRRMAVEARAAKPTCEGGPAPVEFVYTVARYGRVARHRVVKWTAKRLYVEWAHDARNRANQKGWRANDVKATVLDREAFERDGQAEAFGKRRWAFGFSTVFYAAPPKPKTPGCLVALGLALPCTEQDVKRAYKRLAARTHPDAGGAHERFVELGDAYAEALKYVAGWQAYIQKGDA